MTDEQLDDEGPIPEHVDVEALGACTKCDCKKFEQVSGKIRCGNSSCKHSYQRHKD